MRSRQLFLALIALALVLIGGCRTYPDEVGDFRFPILRGNIADGREVFVDYQCHRCHTVDGVELPAWSGERPVTVPLGGDLIFAMTYGDLVTSIINPDHIISDRYLDQLPASTRRNISSPMPYHGDMSIDELVNVVTFLNSRYRLLPGYTEYYY